MPPCCSDVAWYARKIGNLDENLSFPLRHNCRANIAREADEAPRGAPMVKHGEVLVCKIESDVRPRSTAANRDNNILDCDI
jgi:hypothetical protein